MRILQTPFKDEFKELINGAKSRLYISSPFIKTNMANMVVDTLKKGVECRVLTKFTLHNLRYNSLDIKAVESFSNNGFEVKSLDNLHAKIFVIDDKAIVGSSNLTNGGLLSNIEYNILIEDSKVIKDDFLKLYKEGSLVNNKSIDSMQKIIKKLPTLKTPTLNKFNTKDLEVLKTVLTKGNRKVFDYIDSMNRDEFSLNDVYGCKDMFAGETPENSIRRNLQELRDKGLLEFISRGFYKRLW